MKPKFPIENCLNYDTQILKNVKNGLDPSIQNAQPQCLHCKFPTRASDTGDCLKMCSSQPNTPTAGCQPGEYCKTLAEGRAYCHPAPAATNCRVFNAGPSYSKTGCNECKKTFFLDPENKMCTQNCARFCGPGSTCEICGKNRFCRFSGNQSGTCKAPASLLPHCMLYKSGYGTKVQCGKCNKGWKVSNEVCKQSCEGKKSKADSIGVKDCPQKMFCDVSAGKLCFQGKATEHC
jgi:hypothetical protein